MSFSIAFLKLLQKSVLSISIKVIPLHYNCRKEAVFEKVHAGLDGKDVQSHSHTLAHTILKTLVWYVAHLKHCMMCLSIDS